ncbi:uncharacterized protein PAC_08092 [Phialocephala subalpina]|uniref:Uncharacterized protein n=1 Tax=Phialocephala subalpina TaxID=576137 RepID=A0A1L7WZL4_9HELO|nr:uncharacterized protein PAC_08092 [Phialocephala subalpina]
MTSSNLSTSDSQVLTQIFDPESAPTASIVIDQTLPHDIHITKSSLLSQLRKRELEAIWHIESINPSSPSEIKDSPFRQALELFRNLIEEHPNYASAYNNRAQLVRWRYGDSVLVKGSEQQVAKMAKTVLSDLNTAITLGTPSSPSSPVSPGQARLLAQAHTQRATLLYTALKVLKSSNTEEERRSEERFGGKSAEELEDQSARDFFMGGRYGNEISKAMAVHVNPYAKMCGNIVKEAMRQEFCGDGGVEEAKPAIQPMIV